MEFLELLTDHHTAHVGGHDDDGVLEVDGTSLVVGQSSVVEHLQQDVEHVGVRLLDFIEQHHRVGLAPYSLRELSALIVTHVSWRCSDESADAELLLVLAHVDTRHQRLVVEEVVGQCLGQLRLTHTCGAEEDERTDWFLGVLQSSPAASDCIAHCCYGLVLPDHPLVEFLFEVEQLLAFALQHLAHGDARPSAHHIGDVVGGDFLLDHGVATLHLRQLRLYLGNLVVECHNPAVAYLGYPTVVALALSPVGLELQLFDLLLVLLYLVGQIAFSLPFGLVGTLFLLELGNLTVEVLEFLGVALALDGLTFNLQLLQFAADLIQFLRQ